MTAAQAAYFFDASTAGWLNYFPGGRSSGLLLGAAAAFALLDRGAVQAERKDEWRRRLKTLAGPLVRVALPLLLAGSLLVAYFAGLDHGPPQILLGPLVALPTALLLFVVSHRSRATTKLLSHPSLVWLGEVSYSLYLVHILALYIVRQVRHDDSMTTALIGITAALATAALLHRYVEDPVRRSGYKALAERERRAVAAQSGLSRRR